MTSPAASCGQPARASPGAPRSDGARPAQTLPSHLPPGRPGPRLAPASASPPPWADCPPHSPRGADRAGLGDGLPAGATDGGAALTFPADRWGMTGAERSRGGAEAPSPPLAGPAIRAARAQAGQPCSARRPRPPWPPGPCCCCCCRCCPCSGAPPRAPRPPGEPRAPPPRTPVCASPAPRPPARPALTPAPTPPQGPPALGRDVHQRAQPPAGKCAAAAAAPGPGREAQVRLGCTWGRGGAPAGSAVSPPNPSADSDWGSGAASRTPRAARPGPSLRRGPSACCGPSRPPCRPGEAPSPAPLGQGGHLGSGAPGQPGVEGAGVGVGGAGVWEGD